jgi:hypothetical protein
VTVIAAAPRPRLSAICDLFRERPRCEVVDSAVLELCARAVRSAEMSRDKSKFSSCSSSCAGLRAGRSDARVSCRHISDREMLHDVRKHHCSECGVRLRRLARNEGTRQSWPSRTRSVCLTLNLQLSVQNELVVLACAL